MAASLVALGVLALVPRVVVVHDGTRTVLAVQSEQPWPLPPGVKREDGKPVPASLFDALDRTDAPTLEEVWESDPCPEPEALDEGWMGGHGMGGSEPRHPAPYFAPPPMPDRSARVETKAPGFLFEYASDPPTVPLVVGQEVVLHVIARAHLGAGAPTMSFPTKVVVPAPVRGHFPELYAALFERADARTPGTFVTEYVGQFRGPSPAETDLLGVDPHQALWLIRLHVRPRTDAVVLVPDVDESFVPVLSVHHPWTAPIRCVDPERESWQPNPPRPVTAPPVGAAPANLLDLDIPELGLRSGTTWTRRTPLERGALAGSMLGIALAVVAVRRRRPPQGPS